MIHLLFWKKLTRAHSPNLRRTYLRLLPTDQTMSVQKRDSRLFKGFSVGNPSGEGQWILDRSVYASTRQWFFEDGKCAQ
jgi:hypothetical protein